MPQASQKSEMGAVVASRKRPTNRAGIARHPDGRKLPREARDPMPSPPAPTLYNRPRNARWEKRMDPLPKTQRP